MMFKHKRTVSTNDAAPMPVKKYKTVVQPYTSFKAPTIMLQHPMPNICTDVATPFAVPTVRCSTRSFEKTSPSKKKTQECACAGRKAKQISVNQLKKGK